MDLTSEYYNWTEFIIIIVMLCGGLLNISRALVPPKDPKIIDIPKDTFTYNEFQL